MPLPQKIKDDINANSTNTDKASYSRKTNIQAYSDTGTRDKTEDIYYRFKEAKKQKHISDGEYALIKRYFSNNEIKAQNAVIQKSKADLDKIVKTQKEKENPPKPTPPKIPAPQPSPVKPPDLPKIIKPSQVKPNRITDTGTGGLSAFQAAKNVKHISGVDYNYLLSWFKGNEIKAQEVVINLEEDELRGMIGKQKGLSGQVSGNGGSRLTASDNSGTGESNDKKDEDADNNSEPPIDFSFLFPDNFFKAMPSESITEMETVKRDKDNFTKSISSSAFVTLLPGFGVSEEITWDDEGNFGNLTTSYRTVGTPSVAGGIGYTRTDAENIDKLTSQAYEGGLSIGPVSVDAVHGDGYSGDQIAVGPGVTIAEVHGRDSFSDFTWKYDKENKELVINPMLLLTKVMGRGATYIYLEQIANAGVSDKDKNLIRIPLDWEKITDGNK